MFEMLGRFSYRFRWIVIAAWVVLFGLSVVAAPLLADVLKGSFANPEAPAQQAGALIEEKFEQGPATLLVLFRSFTVDARSHLPSVSVHFILLARIIIRRPSPPLYEKVRSEDSACSASTTVTIMFVTLRQNK